MKKRALVLEIGSSDVTAILGEKTENDTLSVLGRASVGYEGYSDGKFFDEQGFKKAVKDAVGSLSAAVRADFKKVYVGVPRAFIKLENRKFKIAYKNKKRIKRRDIEDLFEAGLENLATEGEVIAYSDVYFALDDERKVFDPTGNVSSMLGGFLSYFFCDEYFAKAARDALSFFKGDKIEFIPEELAQSLYFLDGQERRTPSLLVDCGFISTGFTLVSGNGALASGVAELGGGIISGTLADRFGIDFYKADSIKRSINLGLDGKGVYAAERDGEIDEIPSDRVKETVKDCIDEIAEAVDEFVEENSDKLKSAIKVYMLGGGISYMRGAIEYFSSRIGANVEVLKPNVQGYNQPDDATAISLLNYALLIK